MKKVLWLVSWYPNRLDKFDGDFIQRHAKAVALYCKVHVIYVKKDMKLAANAVETELMVNGNLTEEIIYYNATITGFKLLDKYLSQRNYNKQFRTAISHYINKEGKPGIVHVHVAMKAGLAALWIKRKWRVPFIVTEHWTGYFRESVPSVYQYSWWFKMLSKRILKEAEKVLPVSVNLGETIKQNFADINYQPIPNTVNTDYFNLQPQPLEKFRFIHISYMNYQKNPGGILTAARLLKDIGYVFEVFMLGNDDESLKSIADELGLLNRVVFFQAPVQYTDVAGYMQKASAFLLYSRFENLPCVILEALCCGLPVISTNVGGIAEVINEKNGILVENENTERLVHAMKTMMDNYNTYDREAIALNAAEKFNYHKIGEAIFQNY